MKVHLPLLVALSGFVPIGIAVAEYADTPVAPTVAADDHAEDLLALGEEMVERVAKARAQLAAALERARADQDMLLATCLESKLEEMSRLGGMATSQLASLRNAADAGAARLPYVVITVIGQKASLVIEEAALCVGVDRDESGLHFDDIAPPTDPNADLPGGPFDVVQPWVPTSGGPSGDLPPGIPPEASPIS